MVIGELIQEFNNAAENSKRQLADIISTISEGKVPSRTTVGQLTITIADLSAKYDSVVDYAKEQLPESEIPADNSPVFEFENAVINSRSLRLKREFDSSKAYLMRFLTIRSDVAAYEKAMKPLQENVMDFLSSVKEPDEADIEKAKSLAAAPKAILDAIDCQDKDSEEGLCICDKVSEFCPGRIYAGIIANKYYIDTTADTSGQPAVPEETAVHEPENVPAAPEPCTEDAEPVPEDIQNDLPKENDMPEPDNNAPDDAKNTDEEPADSECSEEVSELVRMLTEKNCFINKATDIGTLKVEHSPAESKKISASIFKNEMKKRSSFVIKRIMHSIRSNDIVNLEYLLHAMEIDQYMAQNALDYLYDKGYLVKFTLEPKGSFYCASNRLFKALSFQEACKLVDVPRHFATEYEHAVEDTPLNAINRMALIRMSTIFFSALKNKGVKGVNENVSISDDSFILKYYDKFNPSTLYVAAGCFWDSPAHSDIFLKAITNFSDIVKGASVFIFSAYNLDYAKKISNVFQKYFQVLDPSCAVFIYSFADDELYSYPDFTPFDPSSIINANSEDDQSPESGEAVSDDSAEEVSEINNSAEENVQNEPEEIPEQSQADIPENTAPAQEETETAPVETVQEIPEDEPVSSAAPPEEEQAVPSPAPETPDEDKPYTSILDKIRDSSDKQSALSDLILDILRGDTGTKFSENSPVAQSLMLAKAVSFSDSNNIIAEQLTYALRSPLTEVSYTYDNLSGLLSSPICPEVLMAALLFAMLTPGKAYDFSLLEFTSQLLQKFDEMFPGMSALKPLFAKLRSVHDVIPIGFTPSVLSQLGSASESQKYFANISIQAKQLMSYTVPRSSLKCLPALYNSLFGSQSDLYQCLDYVYQNDTSAYDTVYMVYKQFCDDKNGELSISPQKIESAMDKTWCDVNKQGSEHPISHDYRLKTIKHIDSRLNVIKLWLDHLKVLSYGKLDLEHIKTLRSEIITIAKKTQNDILTEPTEFVNVTKYALKEIIRLLSAPDSKTDLFLELAQTGVISLDENLLPVLNKELDHVKYYEPWATVIRHAFSPVISLEDAKNQILDGYDSSELFDNLHQLEVIGQLIGEDLSSSPAQVAAALESAKDASKKFDDILELAYTYDRISETEKENLAAIKRQHEPDFMARNDFGIWRQFLNALNMRIEKLTQLRRRELQSMLDARLDLPNGKDSPILRAARKLLDEDLNFAVTEEYINRFDNGVEDFSAELQAVLHEKDHFAEFLSDSVFNPIYEECSRKKDANFNITARSYIANHFPKEWTSRLKDDSLRPFGGFEGNSDKLWPTRKNISSNNNIYKLFNWLGISLQKAEKAQGTSEEMYHITVNATLRSMADYRHPIAAFGTQSKGTMNVVILHGNIPAKQLVDKITGLGLGGVTIVLLNYPINRAVRRQISEEFHKTSGQNPFIIIDQVLTIFLALHQITERLPVMLRCTLPYTTYQPFVRDGGSTADEMFFGRTKELNDILNPNGACIVYGGRQLGKTALLERAESLGMKPVNRCYAVYCNILNCKTESAVVEAIIEAIKKKAGTLAQSLTKCDSLKTLCDRFDELFTGRKVENLLLLIDETDNFLGSIANSRYAALQPLIDLKRSTKNRFKFVLAGLHNVCRAKNATECNGVFGQLGTPLCVKPLSPTDALQLLSRPLKYLGFQIERYPHLETILTNTNYYPGILQFFGYMLVETLSTHYGKYYRAVDGNPPYTLRDEQLGAVMNSADLNRSIRDKFRWSLELDPRYFMIARCIASLYYSSDETTSPWLGFSIEQIKEIADDYYDIHCLRNESEKDYRNLLDEMVEMGILSKPNSNQERYRLRRSSFIDIIGSSLEAVEADVEQNNVEV